MHTDTIVNDINKLTNNMFFDKLPSKILGGAP
jgi:hypothetical protein